MTKVYIIRHAEADGNLYRRMHGWYDSALTELGERQLEAVAERFMRIKLDAVYSSDLTRTRRTAEAVARGSGVPVKTTKRLREVNLGAWEDHTWGDAAEWAPEQLSSFNRDPANWSVEGCEPFADTQERMLSTVLELSAMHDGGAIALVSHGAAIRALLARILGVPSDEITSIRHCDNTAVTELTVDNASGAVTVDAMGDNSHLKAGSSRFQRQDWWKRDMSFDASSLRFVPLDAGLDGDAYMATRPDGDWDRARAQLLQNGKSVVWAMSGSERVGLIELDTVRGAGDGAGWIDYYAMLPGWRGRFLSVQLLGHAVSLYRKAGRSRLRLKAFGAAAEYFEHFGFRETEDGVLEKDITV